MTNPYSAIISYTGNDFESFLISNELIDVFECLLSDEEISPYAASIAKYIAYGYSMDSSMLSTDGYNWGKLSQLVFAKCNLPEALYSPVVEFKNESVIDAVQNFLNYQNDENWAQYCTYRDLRSQMLKSALGSIVTASEETNYEQKMKNAIHSQTLLSMMNVAKETFIQNHAKLKGSVESFNRAVSNNEKTTRSVANYAKT